jgi:hypothetical protein
MLSAAEFQQNHEPELSVNQINHPVGFSTATDYPVGG